VYQVGINKETVLMCLVSRHLTHYSFLKFSRPWSPVLLVRATLHEDDFRLCEEYYC